MMNKEFGYPAYGPDGTQVLTTAGGDYRDALMDTAVCRLEAGETRTFLFPGEECAFLLIEGGVTFSWSGETVRGDRDSCFDNGAQVCALHVPRDVPVTLSAHRTAEVFLARTENSEEFSPRFYSAQDIANVTSCAEICGGVCRRQVTTVFDGDTAPRSNLVLGETYPLPGKWCGYPPHSHPQPEVYYYRVDRPEGFGFCCVGDNVYKIKDRSFSLLAHGAMHPQVAAPGYQMYIIWAIRHLPGDPWRRGANLPEYQWLERQP